jgi:dTDP-4-dehydrorhamnose reductase
MTMRILLLGNRGQLGWELERSLSLLGEVKALDYPDVDFTRLAHLHKVVLDIHPQLIVNAAAYTAVDRAESEADLAMLINGEAPGVLAESARKVGAALVHYSTEYVFDGKKITPYTEADEPAPLNAYGMAKLAGDRAIVQVGGAYLVLRSSWIYSLKRENFLTNVLLWAHSRTELRIVTDQIGCPTWARHLAEVTAMLLAKGGQPIRDWVEANHGLYNLASRGFTSRFDWAKEILKLDPRVSEHLVQKVSAAVSTEFPSAAQRPLYAPLDSSLFAHTFNLSLPDWRESLRLAMDTE